ncbi:MAG: MFS transporter [Anaerolineaceae bacterium]|nr:MFS transporter [Anaerolineaceae bacterium]
MSSTSDKTTLPSTIQHPEKDRSWLKSYIPLFIGEAFSILGSVLVQFAIVWWLTDTTGSATTLASGSIAIIVPGALLGPFLGTLVDRLDRRWVLVITDTIISLGTIFLIIMFWLERVEIWHIFVVFGISSIFGSLQWSAMQAVTSTIVPEEHLQRMQGLVTMVQSGITIGAPPLGALLLSILQIYQILSLDVITAVIAVSLIWIIKFPKIIQTNEKVVSPQNMWMDFKEGFSFMTHYRGMLYMVLAFALMNMILEPMFTFFPLYITDYFGLGALELGFISTSWGGGMLLGGLLMSVWGGFKRKMKTVILGNFFFSIFAAMIAAARPDMFWFALAGVLLMAFSNALTNAPIMAILQSKVPKHMQGRIFSLVQSMVSISVPISLLISGPIADKYGVHLFYWVGAIGMALISLLMLIKPIRTIEDQEVDERYLQDEMVAVPE